MSFRTKRLHHWPTQTTYEYAQRWPGAVQKDKHGVDLDDKDPNLQLVGPMFLRPRTIETVPVPGKPPDPDRGFDGEEDDDFEEETPEHWEIWCITMYVFIAYFGDTASLRLGGEFRVDKPKLFEMMRHMIVTRRRIFLHGDLFVDDEWPAAEAMDEIAKRMLEIEGGEEIEEAADKIEEADEAGDESPSDDQVPEQPQPQAASPQPQPQS